jgi:hypothetical protein
MGRRATRGAAGNDELDAAAVDGGTDQPSAGTGARQADLQIAAAIDHLAGSGTAGIDLQIAAAERGAVIRATGGDDLQAAAVDGARRDIHAAAALKTARLRRGDMGTDSSVAYIVSVGRRPASMRRPMISVAGCTNCSA